MRNFYQKHLYQFIFIMALFLSAPFIFSSRIQAQSTAFNFQGRLNDGANPANGNFEMQFKLFSSLSGGSQVGVTVSRPSVAVINGIFSTVLDFGAPAFDGSARFIEIGVRPVGNTNPFSILNPRQQILSTPYAILAKNTTQLGGLDASEYVTTSTVGNSFIKNDTVQQTGNYNISGNGIVGGNLGIGITPTSRLDVNGLALFRPGGSGGNLQIGNPNGETGLSILNTNRADIKFDNSALRLIVGTGTTAPLNTNGITINTLGNVGIGFSNPTSRLYVFSPTAGVTGIYGESQSGRGIWGKSITSRGVYGESDSLEGVYGISNTGAGVAGRSTTNSGVYGETTISSLTAAGVYGVGTGSGSIGVLGQANVNNAIGVYGVSTSQTGFGIFARNPSGGALYADGNVQQNLSSNGLVKAMLLVNADGTINLCYNSQLNGSATSTLPCGFSASRAGQGDYSITFPFQVNNRFFSATLGDINGAGGVQISFNSSTQVRAVTNGGFTNDRFYLIVY